MGIATRTYRKQHRCNLIPPSLPPSLPDLQQIQPRLIDSRAVLGQLHSGPDGESDRKKGLKGESEAGRGGGREGGGEGARAYLQQVQPRLIDGWAVLRKLHRGPDGEGRVPVLQGCDAWPAFLGGGTAGAEDLEGGREGG